VQKSAPNSMRCGFGRRTFFALGGANREDTVYLRRAIGGKGYPEFANFVEVVALLGGKSVESFGDYGLIVFQDGFFAVL
jgi:hypothetical protein